MLNLLVKEYLAICEYLLELEKRRQETEELPLVRKGQLLVDKDMLTMLLETATNKLKYWKDLAWIDAEEKRLTKRICINNRYRPLIVINMQRYECIRDLSIELKKL